MWDKEKVLGTVEGSKLRGDSESEFLVKIRSDSVTLEGALVIPRGSDSLVIFAHGSGSSRLSPRNNYVAKVLREAGFATLLFDLLTEEEDMTYENRFNIDLLAERLIGATRWIKNYPQGRGMIVGYFGASTGAAAALQAAAKIGKGIGAIVSRGGRPDLADPYLSKVLAPTMLIVGERDHFVIKLNEDAFQKISAEKEFAIVHRASHLFEEPGTLEEVARLATGWFVKHLRK